ncbi:MAG TPA: hypothetical protein DDX92_07185 [Flavobacteriales bacterium]|jgi:hypothetical protein|nr:hypothetical protein [Flavobacteriales bacterium]
MRNFLLLISISLVHYLAHSQGCSDAGFCTVDSFKPQTEGSDSTFKNRIKVGSSYGRADHEILVYAAYVEYHREITVRWSLDARLTSLAQTGNDISVFGLSDLYLNTNYKTGKVVFTAGIKVPFNTADGSKDNLPLPMDYQSSLGTFDLLAGIGYHIGNLQFVAALQQPLAQNNNTFEPLLYPEDSPLTKFQSTNNFIRSGDVLLRASYVFKLGNWTLTPALLPIYHLSEDKYTDATGIERNIEGSSGLTLNTNLFVDYFLSDRSALQFSIGAPLIVRENRPDGLTRSTIFNLEYRINF